MCGKKSNCVLTLCGICVDIHYMPSDAAPSTLPEIILQGLPERTKDFLITHAIGTKSVAEVIRETLNAAAEEVAQ